MATLAALENLGVARSLFSLSNNLTFEKDLLPTSGKLLSYVF